MTKKHTATSLGRYLGQRMLYTSPNGTIFGILESVSIDGKCIVSSENRLIRTSEMLHIDRVNRSISESLYPMLKTYDKLIEPMWYEGEEIIPIEYIYNYSSKCRPYRIFGKSIRDIDNDNCVYSDFQYNQCSHQPNFQEVEKLIELGFGAIANSESPTGYVDLFGYPCVLAKHGAEGVE